MAKTMGMRTTITLDPEHITKRVKTSIKKQLRLGVITGGYQSNSAKIADQIATKFELPVIRQYWRGLEIGHIPLSSKAKLLEIVNADWAARLLDAPSYNRGYYADRHLETQVNLTSRTSHGFYLSFFDGSFCLQACAVLGELLTDDDRAKIEQALTVLDGTEPMHIVTYQ
jgi:hypothetical protein